MTIDSVQMGLHGLPLEMLQQIAGYLSNSSLYAFGLASATCHSATIPFIFHQIHLTISSREALQRDVNAIAQTLSHTKSACHVRFLSIKGSLRLPSKPRVEGYKSGTADRHSCFEAKGLGEILSDEEPCYGSPHVVYDEPVIAKASQEDLAWAPVVGLIKTLPCLTKLIYNCQNQFPPSLLDALHNYHPQCKLYHLTFRFRTLLWGTPYPYEMALATSPCLYSVRVECSTRDSEGDDDFNQEAMMELVAGLAPNLKEVVVVNLCPERSRKYYRPRELWRGLPGSVSGRSIGSLTSLSLLGWVNLRYPGLLQDWANLLQTWARHTDFSRLLHLTLGGGNACEGIGMNDEVMEWIVQNYSFPRLKTLHIRLTRDDTSVERPNYSNSAIAFLGAFEPLDQLSVSGPLEPKILDAILYRHGQTLKKLNLRSLEHERLSNGQYRRDIPMTFTKEHVLQICAQCPALQELAVPVKRTKSDALEAEIYKSFSKMERLTSLFLTLDCSNWRVTRDSDLRDDALFHTNISETRRCRLAFLIKGHLQETLINCAVDETLARSIWETICQSKAGQKLESLKLWTTGGGHWGVEEGYYCRHIIRNLSRSWLIERVARDDEDIINVRELGRRAREARDEEVTNSYKRQAKWFLDIMDTVKDLWDIAEDTTVYMEEFRRVWPRKGSKDWRKDWSRFPLQV